MDVAFWIFIAAGVSDAVDGYLAKRLSARTVLGSYLDPLADKLLLVVVFVSLSVAGLIPWWLTVLVLLRDLVILFGAITFRLLFGPVQGQPTVASKINTLSQVLYCLAVVAKAASGFPPPPTAMVLGALVTVTTVVSGLDYTLIYARRAAAVSRADAAGAH
jgi:cardiolipin synthase